MAVGPKALLLTFTGTFTRRCLLLNALGSRSAEAVARKTKTNDGSNDDSQDRSQGKPDGTGAGSQQRRRTRQRCREGRHALPLHGFRGREARDPAKPRPPRVCDASGGGLRVGQATRDGLRDDHRPRHDRRLPRARGPSGRVRLRGADRLVRGRAAGRSRALLRDRSGGPRVSPSARRRPRALRRVPARARDRVRARPSVLLRRRAARTAPPLAPGRAVRGLGGAQRLACPGAEHAGGGVHGDPRGYGNRRV